MCFQRVVEPLIDPCQNSIGRLVLDRGVQRVQRQPAAKLRCAREAGARRREGGGEEGDPLPPRSHGSVWGTPKNFPVFFLKGVSDVV